MKRAVFIATLLLGQCWAQLPDAPQPQPVKTFTFEPHRTNKQTLASPWFILPHAAAFGAAVWERGRCTYSSNGSLAGGKVDAFVPVIAITAVDYVLDRWVWRGFSLAGASYIIATDTYGGITKQYQ